MTCAIGVLERVCPELKKNAVIPAKAGIQKVCKKSCVQHAPDWIPAFAGMTGWLELCASNRATFAGQGDTALAPDKWPAASATPAGQFSGTARQANGGGAFGACEHCYPQLGPQKVRTSLHGAGACRLSCQVQPCADGSRVKPGMTGKRCWILLVCHCGPDPQSTAPSPNQELSAAGVHDDSTGRR